MSPSSDGPATLRSGSGTMGSGLLSEPHCDSEWRHDALLSTADIWDVLAPRMGARSGEAPECWRPPTHRAGRIRSSESPNPVEGMRPAAPAAPPATVRSSVQRSSDVLCQFRVASSAPSECARRVVSRITPWTSVTIRFGAAIAITSPWRAVNGHRRDSASRRTHQ